jgi:hypothetical protein
MLASTHNSNPSLVHRGEGEISALDLPHLHGVKPVVRGQVGVKVVVRPRSCRQHVALEELGVRLQGLVSKPCADLRAEEQCQARCIWRIQGLKLVIPIRLQ